jgi:hypothetical protein
MSTRKELHSRVVDALEPELNKQGVALADRSAYGDVAYAAIEAVINTIGDHALAQMIGDTAETSSNFHVETLNTFPSAVVETLQDEDDDA